MFNIAEAMETIHKLQKIAEDYNRNLELMGAKLNEVNRKLDALHEENMSLKKQIDSLIQNSMRN